MNFSTGPLLLGLLFSTIGMAMFIYGKKIGHITHLLCGGVLMVFPFFIGNVWLMLAIGSLFTAGPFLLGDLMG